MYLPKIKVFTVYIIQVESLALVGVQLLDSFLHVQCSNVNRNAASHVVIELSVFGISAFIYSYLKTIVLNLI